ncbi:NAD-dependent epimerase/dehydratase family protein [Mycobacterium sp. 360MFTsu5.1]|uniref:NAD-dependent epimerase/dehydratase family protein n=1 Tax=Mycobacterium sp. 360MFTsu5.1 TaxID=1172186 RepID=UPI00039CA9F4|nr:NAD-dependent epimerase/dehydratase family protein [Mycobacterium sp. 360MFTsu5.1]
MRVLVTGGTGFIAGWCIAALLAQGYEVCATVRNISGEEHLRTLFADRVTCAMADLTADEGWESAMAGIDYLLHIASPLTGDDMLTPARDGTTRVLEAAAAEGVSRVVVTSSSASATPDRGESGVFDETLWSGPQAAASDAYRVSKVLAERAAWDVARIRGLALSTVLPGVVFGPLLSMRNAASVDIIGRMLTGMRGVPNIGLNIVDVRDVADLHIRALTDPRAIGQRYLAVSGPMSMPEIAAYLRAQLGDRAKNVPTRTIPNSVIKALAKVNPEMRAISPFLDRNYTYSNVKARALGWEPRPVRETVIDCAEYLLANAS